MPLPLTPLKMESAEPPEGAGAGAGKVSPVPELVGWNVPVVSNAVGSGLAAASSRVRVIPETSSLPPTSDMMMAFWPPGPTSRISISDGKVWVRFLSLTITLVTVPVRPATVMLEGYGAPAPLSGMVIAAGLVNEFWPQGVGVGVTVGLGVGVGVGIGVGVGVGEGVIPGLRVGTGVGVTAIVVKGSIYRSNALNVPFGFVPSQFELSPQTG
ncbi:MAG: hypothetical protein DMF06_13325 [Verrucomicrobia bacterium]|nr:MAG: hypothetical protein DMF06_13325 [Verrucomicrobiota bacterium]